MNIQLRRFLDWFELDNLYTVERATNEEVLHSIQRYARQDADLEFDLREQLYGPGGYLVW